MGLQVSLLVLLSGCQLVFSLDRPVCGDHDEDGDGVFDLCDNCVGVANPGQEDEIEDQTAGGTADGIGDACDPNPMASDQVLLTITFDGAEENNQWLPASTQTGWRFDLEAAVFEGTVVGEQAVIRSLRAQPPRPFVIEYQVTVNQPYDRGYIGVRADTDQSTALETDEPRYGVECGVLHNPREADGVLTAFSSAGHRNVAAPAVEGGLLVETTKAQRYRVQMRYDVPLDALGDGDEDLRCIVEPEGAPATQSQINFVAPLPPGTELALAAVTASAQIDYLVIYRGL